MEADLSRGASGAGNVSGLAPQDSRRQKGGQRKNNTDSAPCELAMQSPE